MTGNKPLMLELFPNTKNPQNTLQQVPVKNRTESLPKKFRSGASPSNPRTNLLNPRAKSCVWDLSYAWSFPLLHSAQLQLPKGPKTVGNW